MSVPPTDYYPGTEVVAAAREFIRREGEGCVVSIGQLLDELSDKFGDVPCVTGSVQARELDRGALG